MDAWQTLQRVREIVRSWFDQHGADPSTQITETLLVRGGFLYGRRFSQAPFSADWDIATSRVTFHGADRSLIEALNVESRAAA